MNFIKEVEQMQLEQKELFTEGVLHISNGQVMHDTFLSEGLIGNSDAVPFNEAMCVHPTSKRVFDHEFIRLRAEGHRDSIENYRKMVVEPLEPLFQNQYNTIILWFGEDVFCQMNLLTALAYLEQSDYQGKVILHSFRDEEFGVAQTEILLGSYQKVYEEVLLNHRKPDMDLLPVMHQAVELQLKMFTEENSVTRSIKEHAHLPEIELVKHLMAQFPELGYGDTQYLEIIERVRNKK